MDWKREVSDVPDTITVPRRAVIVDLNDINRYIQSREVLYVFVKQLGFESFIEQILFTAFDQDIDDFEDALSNFFDLDEVEKLEIQGFHKYELHEALCDFQVFRDRTMFGLLDPTVQEEFLEYGFHIHRWLSPKQAIIKCNSTDQVSYASRQARNYRSSYATLGSDDTTRRSHQ